MCVSVHSVGVVETCTLLLSSSVGPSLPELYAPVAPPRLWKTRYIQVNNPENREIYLFKKKIIAFI